MAQEELSLSTLHHLLTTISPPLKPGESPNRLFITKELSILAPTNSYDEVYPNIYLGNHHFAKDKELLRRVGITHIINSAQGNRFHQVDTDSNFYAGSGITFLGIRAMDSANFKLHEYFTTAVQFIDDALKNGGRVAVHCSQGMSRSAALVLAYLMTKEGLRLEDAVTALRGKRAIFPNDGFLRQLIDLDVELFPR